MERTYRLVWDFEVRKQIRLIANWTLRETKSRYEIMMPDGKEIYGVAISAIDSLILDWCDGNVHQMRDFVVEFRG